MAKSSDRRLAGGARAARFLHGAQKSESLGIDRITRPEAATEPGKSQQFSHKPPSFHSSSTSKVSKVSKPDTTVRRSAHGKSWEDDTLVEWDPNHFRLFVGNLGPDANDQLLVDAFDKYPTFVRARVPRDKRTDKNRGYGFVAFSSADDYLRAFKEMNGKYVGLHPVQLKRAEPVKRKEKGRKG
ncbi:hypothetical protein JA9_003710 [Meyerozyma sp. JA9]|nr:hypothetical protein JA9_003710 [Meyerozyma sp. JA9]